jgi:hypothetical protein
MQKFVADGPSERRGRARPVAHAGWSGETRGLAMYIATSSDDADAFGLKRRSTVMSTPLSIQLRRWLTEAWMEHKQRRIERLVLQIGHPGVIVEMRRARELRDRFAAWN